MKTERERQADVDDTARLILMDDPEISMAGFRERLTGEVGYVNLRDLGDLWMKYRGWDGRSGATHDIATGERLPNTVIR